MQLTNESSNSDVTFEHKYITSYLDVDVNVDKAGSLVHDHDDSSSFKKS